MPFLIVQMPLILTCLCFLGRLLHFQANPKETSCSFALSESAPFICVPVLSFLFLTLCCQPTEGQVRTANHRYLALSLSLFVREIYNV